MPFPIPHAPGKSTPAFVESMLDAFGRNQYDEPNFRLIWSARPMNYLAGEIVPTYEYLGEPRWILETWLAPEKFAGAKESWGAMQEALTGEYPAQGGYFITDPRLPSDWEPNEHHVSALVQGLLATRGMSMSERRAAKTEAIEKTEREAVMENASEIVESFDSASLGRTQQSVTGPKNTFRTPEDFERDRDREAWRAERAAFRGAKIYQPGE